MALLELSAISKKNERGSILSDISFTQDAFHKLAISGETGSGKSTLLKIVAGLIQADSGQAFFNGTRIKGPEEQLLPGRPDIAYLSQQYELRNHYRVEELLDMANKMTDDAANEIYDICRISHLVKRRTDQLSGGEKQRIALARLLVTAPKLLILDEPFSNLDLIHKTILKSVIEAIGHRLKITCILASHDPMDVLSWADEIMVLKDGAIVQSGSPRDLYDHPRDEYIAGLFGKYNLLSAELCSGLFPDAANKLPAGRMPFIRPEKLTYHLQPSLGAVQGIIDCVRFMGAYYEISVQIGKEEITLITWQDPLPAGTLIFVHATVNASLSSW